MAETESLMTHLQAPEILQKRLDDFSNSPIVDDYAKRLDAEPVPSLIYHYTDGAGLRGIFKTGKIWCTDIFSLNDPSEIRHGVSYPCELLRAAASAADANAQLRSFAAAIAEEILRERIEDVANLFVCCFSANGDDLGQWRAYADDGRGYAIGFDTVLLERAFIDAAPEHHITFPVKYDERPLREIQAKLVEQAKEILSIAAGQMTGHQLTRLAACLSMHIIRCSLFFKHKGYSNEQEYRFLKLHRGDLPVQDLKLRSRPYSLIRYCEFDWKRTVAHALKKVVIGPAADSKIGLKFVDDCARRFLPGMCDIDISQSEIPYRCS